MSIRNSEGVNNKNSSGIHWSNGINRSNGINGSNGINRANGINGSNGINRANGINGSNGIHWSNGINGSSGVNRSSGINGSFGVINSFGVDKAIFLADKKREFTIFNMKVDESRFDEIWDNLFRKLNGWYPKFHNALKLYKRNGNSWSNVNANKIKAKLDKWEKPNEAWKGMPVEAIEYVKLLPEFNAEIFKRITGIDIKEEEKEIEIGGKKYSEQTIKRALQEYVK